ncbi:hypothetical protein [Pseudonocardia zijingensis]|jgi:hypothetical protein|uniref:Signal recognition particle-docking protein FtsY n=1 Tax=Pseudonocardia zijingensis TaxID=153376 RepID=A0ABN1N804_9PSEU
MFDRIRALLRRPETAEDDVRPDPDVARTRETGGLPTEEGDSAATTGTGESGSFVGQVAGQDPGVDEESGAEARRRQ